MLTAEQIRELLNMRPHPIEGGYFSETYRGAPVIPQSLLPGYPADRAISTAIYYMLTPDTFRRSPRARRRIVSFLFGRSRGDAAVEAGWNRRSVPARPGHRRRDAFAAQRSWRSVAGFAPPPRWEIRADGNHHGPGIRIRGLRNRKAPRANRTILGLPRPHYISHSLGCPRGPTLNLNSRRSDGTGPPSPPLPPNLRTFLIFSFPLPSPPTVHSRALLPPGRIGQLLRGSELHVTKRGRLGCSSGSTRSGPGI